MEGRMRRYGARSSPERTRVWVEPQPPPPMAMAMPKQHSQSPQPKKVPVVYYLCRNRHLEHPHFMEVPLSSSSEALYLRDVIIRLNALRGKGMAAMYSWSCKRSYKNGFVWHDLSEDDLVHPAQGNEYILKGSELLDRSPPDRQHHGASNTKIENSKQPQQESPTSCRNQEVCSSSSSPTILVEGTKLPPPSPLPPPPPTPPSPPPSTLREDEPCHTPRSGSSGNFSPEPKGRTAPSSRTSSLSPTEYRIYKPVGAQDASTQTDDRKGKNPVQAETRTTGVSTDDGPLDFQERDPKRTPRSNEQPEMIIESSPPLTSSSVSSGGRIDTLESLIRAEASKRNSFRILEEEEVYVPVASRLRATNLLMHLITCGSISVKDHRSFGLVPTYRPRFTHMNFPSPFFSTSMMVGDMDGFSEKPRMMGMRLEGAEYFSGSLLETKRHKEGEAGVPILKRSSSFDEDRTSKIPDSKGNKENLADSSSVKCLPRAMKMASCRSARNETIRSPISDAGNSSAVPECSGQSSPLCSSKGGSKRITDSSSAKGSSRRLESFKEEKEKACFWCSGYNQIQLRRKL
ncbi:protein UPSTREAM OF FLC-like isoform X2 [Ananas comosus]|uniref:Protein UPSTREAM OF FLC-like isoform X2 n=1 Tax=Ananas comosus TaxID=4615 RepID=A0A6P5HBY0_ANACO|nr:protein UPSTREAM OF FLC-like isoform X2 [Ananas comosus]